MRQEADADGVDLATYARDAVQRYAVQASDEEWVMLMGLIGRAADPGLACLKRAFENALRGCLISSPNAVSKIAENEKPATAGLEWWAL
jgi:hypothetical protein